ncbi:hypothetical protein CZ771_01785 [Actinomycetales bacterium JB111]|nr:hypothetical protein CZ771_01785 [Actinomycetales bacterium JB111]
MAPGSRPSGVRLRGRRGARWRAAPGGTGGTQPARSGRTTCQSGPTSRPARGGLCAEGPPAAVAPPGVPTRPAAGSRR